MESVKILHCADVHIGASESFLGQRASLRRFETLITFENIISTAKDNKVDILLIAGDLFNSNRIEKSFVDGVFATIEKIPEINVIFSAGNHEPLESDSPFLKHSLPKNLFVLDTKDCFVEFKELNVRVYGRSFGEIYCNGSPAFSLKPDDNFINIMCIHGELKSDLNSDYNSITENFITSSGMDYIALGHIHKRTDIGRLANTSFAYCGCPEGQGFDELGEKGVYIGEISKGKANLEFKRVCQRMHLYHESDIADLTDSAEISRKVITDIKEKFGEGFENNLYKISLTGKIPENCELDLSEILSRISNEVYYAKIHDDTSFETDFETLLKENSLKGIFVRKMLEKIDENPDESEKYLRALKIGITAFSSEVNFNEN